MITGIIPAYAGSTVAVLEIVAGERDHPRIRGEHYPKLCSGTLRLGSSPHTRGALGILRIIFIEFGIIPAYAGSTGYWAVWGRKSSDHPRIRGEHYAVTIVVRDGQGSSPHTRGAR